MESITSFDGTRICYHDIGTGYPLVISATFGYAPDLWTPIFDACKSKFRFIWICHRALFGSGVPADFTNLSMEASGKDIGLVLDTLKLEKFGAVGYCSGNFPLCEYLLHTRRFPERIVLSSPRYGTRRINPNEPEEKRMDRLIGNPKAREAGLKMIKQQAETNPTKANIATYESFSVPGAFEAQIWQIHHAGKYSIQAPKNPPHKLHISLVAGENEGRSRYISELSRLFSAHTVTSEFIPGQDTFFWKEVPDLMIKYLERTFLSP